jgi:hypothetical protein
LLRKLHGDLVESLRHAIAQHEGQPPESRNITQLITGRDWLFEDNNYHVDTSHLAAVIRFSIDLSDRATLLRAVELAEYGKRLSPLFHYKGTAPFEDVYVDYGMYLETLLGDDVERGIGHFRQKLATAGSDEAAVSPAQTLVNLLARLHRYSEAIDVWLDHLAGVDPGYLNCPTAVQLCAMAGDHGRMKEVARRQQDLISYAAAVLRKPE